MPNLEYYKPSKGMSLWVFPLLLVMLFIIAPLLSIAYAELQSYFENKIISVIIYLVLLILLWFFIFAFKYFSKLTNSVLSVIFSLLFVLTVFYLHHSVYLYIGIHNVFDEYDIGSTVNIDGSDDNYFSLAMNPSLVWTYFNLETTIWSVAFWILELIGLLIIVYISELFGDLSPYSSKTNKYYDVSTITVNQIDKELLLNAIKNKDFSKIGFIEKHIIGSESYSVIEIYFSPNDPTYLSLSDFKAVKSYDDDLIFVETLLIKYVLIDKELEKLLLGINDLIIEDYNPTIPKTDEGIIPQKEIHIRNEAIDPKIFFTFFIAVVNLFSWFYFGTIISLVIGVIVSVILIVTVVVVYRLGDKGFDMALTISPSKIKFFNNINVSNEDAVFNTEDIAKIILDVDYDEGSKFKVYFNNSDNPIVLNILKANIDSFELEKKMNLLINTTLEQRTKIIKEWM